jgi:phosphoserine phosphatase RsbU/P
MNMSAYSDSLAQMPVATVVTTSASAHVLVVDDLEINRDLLARRVKRLGHTFAFAASGKEALDCLRASSFDLVLLDITMPEMDGYEALAQIKADPKLAHIPVVMVTAIDGVDSIVRCLELGAEDYITKPFNPVILRARIESSLNKKRLADLNVKLLNSLSREMLIAQRIQLGFLPESLPQIAGWPIAASCVPAKHVGGDFFDAMVLPGGQLALTVADVCDKGVGAALYMALFRSLLRISLQQAEQNQPAEQVLEKAASFTNDYIATVHARDNMFATVFIAILCPQSGRLDYINAGHDAPLLLRHNSSTIESLPPQGLALGMMAGESYHSQHIQINTGDNLFMFSDGLPEALNSQNMAFGEARVLSAFRACAHSPQALLAILSADLAQHIGERPPHDDVTMLSLFAEPRI